MNNFEANIPSTKSSNTLEVVKIWWARYGTTGKLDDAGNRVGDYGWSVCDASLLGMPCKGRNYNRERHASSSCDAAIVVVG